ncbi:MAG: hypothetical protein J7480_03145 [Microbacteriaceae bacterium]|nr:hypothetical protein [Microbacteriaceae bacterium]
MKDFTADEIRALLAELADRLDRAGIAASILVLGGSAIALHAPARGSTRDIDAVLRPRGPILAVAHEMAVEHGLPSAWLSDGVVDTLHGIDLGTDTTTTVAAAGRVHIAVASTELLLALKATTTRDSETDLDDAVRLAAALGATTESAVEAIVRRFIPGVPGSLELRFERIAALAAARG